MLLILFFFMMTDKKRQGMCFRSPTFESMHARDLRRSARTIQKHVHHVKLDTGTLRSLSKHSLGEGTPL